MSERHLNAIGRKVKGMLKLDNTLLVLTGLHGHSTLTMPVLSDECQGVQAAFAIQAVAAAANDHNTPI